jgi:uncharacterized membrane protein
MKLTKQAALGALSLTMIGVGIDHFVNPLPFERIVPAWLPSPHTLVLFSGFFEVCGGIGVLVPRTRCLAAWGLIALYVAVFPANINMAIHHIQLNPADTLPIWAMWAGLPFQGLFIAWAYWVTRETAQADAANGPPHS